MYAFFRGAVFLWMAACAALGAENASNTPDRALAALVEGNRRYRVHHLRHPHQTAGRRAALTKGQHPFAAVLSCSDSRVPPEIIFDQGLGDLFIVRVAGNVADDVVIGSLEYAVEHLGVPLVVVLGHQHCGAVEAAVKGGEPHDHVASLVAAIRPAVDSVRPAGGDVIAHAVLANVRRVTGQLGASQPILHETAAGGKIKIVGAVYDLDSGKVEILP